VEIFIDEFENEWEIYDDGTYKLIKEIRFAEFCLPTPEYREIRKKQEKTIQDETLQEQIEKLKEQIKQQDEIIDTLIVESLGGVSEDV